MKYRFAAYVLYGAKFKAILARASVIDKLVYKLKKQGFGVKRVGCKAGERLKYRNWVYY